MLENLASKYRLDKEKRMQYILTLNGGSSSIKFALFENDETLKRIFSGTIKRIGSSDTTVEITDQTTGKTEKQAFSAPNIQTSIQSLTQLIKQRVSFNQIVAVGHRIVHGGIRFTEPQLVTPDMLDYLDTISPYDPEHLPSEITMIKALSEDNSQLRQVACFDTAFHKDMPHVAKMLPIPRRYFDQGVQRYGFHGLSYQFLMSELKRLSPELAGGRVILAHLGNGASMAAVNEGKSIDTTMAFTPTAGLVMSTRSGDLDPGVVAYLARSEKMSADQFYQMAHSKSGLLGVSETSSDMQDLLEHEKDDPRAAEAIELFCYTAKKYIGAYFAALGGLDVLVFAGGIGENAAEIRQRICGGFDFIGIRLDDTRNKANAPIISADSSHSVVRVMKTDEEVQIARLVRSVPK
jgi:acetate kinase